MSAKPEFAVQNQTSSRRTFLQTTVFGAVGSAILPTIGGRGKMASAPIPQSPSFEFDEATVDRLQQSLSQGALSSHALTEKYLARIAAMDKQGPAVNAIIELNPDALSIVDQLDKAVRELKSRSNQDRE